MALRVMLLFMMWLSWGAIGQAQQVQQAQRLFDEGNQLLRDGKVMEAMKQYKQVMAEGAVSGPLYLNMAIIYADMDSLGKAKAFFMKAAQFDETALQAEQGLLFVDKKLPNRPIQLPKLPWDKAVDELKEHFTSTGLSLLGLLFFNLMALSLVLVWLKPNFGWMKTYVPLGLLVLCVLAFSLSVYLNYHYERYATAVLITSQSSLKEKPMEDSGVVSLAYEGFTFLVDRNFKADGSDWLYVRMSNGQYGWIKSDHVLTF